MFGSYWDPAKLLNIHYSAGRITCVGKKTRNDGRSCSHRTPDAKHSSTLAVISSISRVPPENVTRADLAQLASLCLCTAHHYNQRSEIASRWHGTLQIVSRHHANLSGSAPRTSAYQELCFDLREKLDQQYRTSRQLENEVAALNNQLQRDQRASASVNSQLKDLFAESTSSLEVLGKNLAKERREASAARRKAEAEKTALQVKLDETHDLLQALRLESVQAKESNEAQLAKLEETNNLLQASRLEAKEAQGDNEALRVELNEIKNELQGLRLETNQAHEDNEALRSQIKSYQKKQASLEDILSQHRVEEASAKEREKQVAADLEAQNSAAQQYSRERDEEKAHNLALEQQVATLEASEAQLRGLLSKCWSHRLKMRIRHVKTSLRMTSGRRATVA